MNDRFLRACRGLPVDRPPIWLMRQAGRYLPEYRALRARLSMREAVSTPEIAVEATLQPIRRFGFDAAILFSDLTVPFEPMGAPFEIREGVGPVVERPIRTEADVAALRPFDPEEGLGFTFDTIRILKRELRVPLIGFTGAPFTLASYLIEGGPSRDLRRTRAMIHGEPALWHALMDRLAGVVLAYLRAQIKAGADAVQLFDSWVGYLDATTYRRALAPHMKRIFNGLRPLGAPVIHFGTGTAALLPVMREAGGDVIGVDWRVSLEEAASAAPGVPLQGNLDPALLLAGPEAIDRGAEEVLRAGRAAPGHIFNLGHGVFPETPIAAVERLVEVVQGKVAVA